MMKRTIFFALAVFTLFSSCKKDEEENNMLSLAIDGLENLGDGYAYEGWIIVNGTPKTTGTFTVDGNGDLSQTKFTVNEEDLEAATAFVLTVEPSPDSDPAPSNVHILAGDFSNNTATLTVGHGSALGTDFGNASGSYILATPTNGENSDENSGIWWLDPAKEPGASLTLPTLPTGWTYEGWVVIDGTPVTTGKFTNVSAADSAAPYSSTQQGPPFPGEDFLVNAPSGLTFPTDLAGKVAVISVEPVPDNSSSPFLLKPLKADIPASATDHTSYNMANQAATTNPAGTASK